jgi:prepilin-type N-terminal cleavage/methylation domain-containing protein
MIRNKSGFTMTELMVVLGIIAIASAIAVPNFSLLHLRRRVCRRCGRVPMR